MTTEQEQHKDGQLIPEVAQTDAGQEGTITMTVPGHDPALLDHIEQTKGEVDATQMGMTTGIIKKMPFQQAYLTALGTKETYYSANNSAVDAPDGTNSVSRDGAVFLKPDSRDHVVTAQVLDCRVQGDLLKTAKSKDILCELPIAYKLREKQKSIASITDREAQDAGYANRRQLQLRLALQTDQADAFATELHSKMIGFLVPQLQASNQINNLPAFVEMIWPLVLEGLRFGNIKVNNQGDLQMAQQAAAIVDTFHKTLLKDEEIPGTTDVFQSRVAKPEELVTAGQCQTEEEAKKVIGVALNRMANNLGPMGVINKRVRDAIADVVDAQDHDKDLNDLEKEMQQRIQELLGVEEKPELSLKAQIMTSGREIGDWERGRLLHELEKAGEDQARIAEIRAEFDRKQAEAKERGPSVPSPAYG